mgnify:CR=1 FL=1
MADNKEKLWGGRFREQTDELVEEFTSSLRFDRRLYAYDIEGSIAHARMLAKQKIIKKTEEAAIVAGLKDIEAQIDRGEFARSEDRLVGKESRSTL